jgi:hypothetical protein
LATIQRALKPTPQRCGSDLWPPCHDDEAGALQMLHKAFGDNLRHDLVGVVDALAAFEAQRIGERVGEIAWVGRNRSAAKARQSRNPSNCRCPAKLRIRSCCYRLLQADRLSG